MSMKVEGNLNIESFNLGPSGGIQLQFAKLQLLLAETSKGQAMEYINSITEAQEKSREVAEMIQKCRELQSQAKEEKGGCWYSDKEPKDSVNFSELTGKTGDALTALNSRISGYTESDTDYTALPDNIKTFMKDNGLTICEANNQLYFDSDQWDINIKSLQNYQEQIGTDTQQKMVFVSDFMGQYNSYIQGASTAVQQSNQTLSTVARGQ